MNIGKGEAFSLSFVNLKPTFRGGSLAVMVKRKPTSSHTNGKIWGRDYRSHHSFNPLKRCSLPPPTSPSSLEVCGVRQDFSLETSILSLQLCAAVKGQPELMAEREQPNPCGGHDIWAGRPPTLLEEWVCPSIYSCLLPYVFEAVYKIPTI